MRSESVEDTAFLEIRLVGGLFSFPLKSVVRLVHLAGRSTVPTGPASEKTVASWFLVYLTGTLGHDTYCLGQGRVSLYFLHQRVLELFSEEVRFGSRKLSFPSEMGVLIREQSRVWSQR